MKLINTKIEREKTMNNVQFKFILHVNFNAELKDGIKTEIKNHYFEVIRAEDLKPVYLRDLHYFDIEKLLQEEILENYQKYYTILNNELTQYNLRIGHNDLEELKDLANDNETTVSELIRQQIKKLLK